MSLARNLSKLAQFLNGSGLLTSLGLAPDAVQVGMKNRIINGAMMIDQRNAGASVATTATGNAVFTIDRWAYIVSQASKFTVQQNAGSVTPPVGFTNYLGVTSTSAYSVTSTDYFGVYQPIEGFNTADLGWGTANAASVTVSFWVRSSLTGTFGGTLKNSAGNRSYPFSYTISSANTWEQKTVTIAGDTAGTWLTTNGIGAYVQFSLGVGSTYSNTAGAWAAGNYTSATGATSVVGTSGATFYITGVQLEKGSTATSFDYRPYGTELALCQRYYQKSYAQATVPGTATGVGSRIATILDNTSLNRPFIMGALLVVTMRTQPSISYWSADGTAGAIMHYSAATNLTVSSSSSAREDSTLGSYLTTSTNGVAYIPYVFQFAATAEL